MKNEGADILVVYLTGGQSGMEFTLSVLELIQLIEYNNIDNMIMYVLWDIKLLIEDEIWLSFNPIRKD